MRTEQFAGCFLIFSNICFKIRWHGETYISVKDTTSATNAGFIQFYRCCVLPALVGVQYLCSSSDVLSTVQLKTQVKETTLKV